MPSEPLRDFALKPERWQRELRAFGVLFLAFSAGFWPSPWREAFWALLVVLLRLGFLTELSPVYYREGWLVRGERARPAREVRDLVGAVLLGVWPRFGVRFEDGERWWLPLGRGWTLLWEELRRIRPELPDWRKTPLCPYYLMLATSDSPSEAVPGELIELALRLRLKGKAGLGFLALVAVSALGGVLSGLLTSPRMGHWGELGLVVVLGIFVEGAVRTWEQSRLRRYCEGI